MDIACDASEPKRAMASLAIDPSEKRQQANGDDDVRLLGRGSCLVDAEDPQKKIEIAMSDGENDDGERQIAEELRKEQESQGKKRKRYLADEVELASFLEEHRCDYKEHSRQCDADDGGNGDYFNRACSEREADASHDAVDQTNEYSEADQARSFWRRCIVGLAVLVDARDVSRLSVFEQKPCAKRHNDRGNLGQQNGQGHDDAEKYRGHKRIDSHVE